MDFILSVGSYYGTLRLLYTFSEWDSFGEGGGPESDYCLFDHLFLVCFGRERD